jgi:deferrochelatase/peroxidase EfeB
MPGFKVPNGAHIRRMNTRDYLDPLNKEGVDGSGNPYPNKDATHALNKRRRILRRGLPYGAPDLEAGDDDTEQGVAMMVLCASLFRQFEFVQQQWIQYGLDFNAGNLTCPVVGNHGQHARFVIPSRPESGQPPFICANLPDFVQTRGGEYFFIPSMTALRMIGMGTVDPT